jgi:hypothetical protein
VPANAALIVGLEASLLLDLVQWRDVAEADGWQLPRLLLNAAPTSSRMALPGGHRIALDVLLDELALEVGVDLLRRSSRSY